MQQSWTLSFRDFGKVKSGEIDIAPLVLMIGDNNSGKSYVMSLVWGVLTEGRKLFPKEVPSSIAYQEVDHFLEQTIGQNKKLTAEESSLFIEWFNDILKNKKQELLYRIFRKKLPISSLRIEQYHREKPLELRFEQKDSTETTRYSSSQDYVRLPYTLTTKEQATERYRMAQYITWTLLMDQLSSPLHPVGGRRSIESRAIGEALYLPASRTGFMLTYRTLVQDMMEKVIDQEDEEDIEFTLPVYRFLQGLIRLDEKSKSNCQSPSTEVEGM